MKNHYNKLNSMDSIQPPEKKQIKALNDPSFGKLKSPEDVFRMTAKSVGGNFKSAEKAYTDHSNCGEEKHKDFDDELPIPEPVVRAKGLKRGVKFGKVYITKGKLLKWCAIGLGTVAIILTFFPPLFFSQVSKSGIDFKKNPFEKMGLNELESYALSNCSIYNEKAFSSDLGANYKVLKLVYEVGNFTPYKLKIPQFKVTSVASEFENNICYATNANIKNGEPVACEIPPFSSEDVNVEILMNVGGLSDKQIDEAITSLVISTVGMKKIAAGIELPSIPAVVWVSNNIEADTLEES